MITRNQVVYKAREYLGTPFHHIGRQKGLGVDCIGLVSGVAIELGITHHDLKAYSRQPDGETLLREFAKCLLPIPIEEAKPGDVLVFKFGRHPTHAGIKTDHGLIHTYAMLGLVVEHNLDAPWQKRLCAAFRYPGVEGEFTPEEQIPRPYHVEETNRRMQQGCCN